MAVALVTIAFALAGGAVLSAIGAVSWPGALAVSHGAPSEGGTAVPAADAQNEAAASVSETQAGPSPDAADPAEPWGGAEDASDLDVPVATPADDSEAGPEPDEREPADESEAGSEPGEGEPADESEAGSESDEGEPADESQAGSEGDEGELADAVGTAQVQEHLREAGFLIGAADGEHGKQTTAAVVAFQKVNGLTVDGVVGPETTRALLDGSAEPSLRGGPESRIEVDLDAQLLHLVEEGERVVTLHVSSGDGGTYTTASGTTRSLTPVGDFVIERRIHGVRNAPLGTLYDPLYFHHGFAIHGSASVPTHPDSHGCVRVTKADAAWLIERVPDGLPVHLHGGTHVFAP